MAANGGSVLLVFIAGKNPSVLKGIDSNLIKMFSNKMTIEQRLHIKGRGKKDISEGSRAAQFGKNRHEVSSKLARNLKSTPTGKHPERERERGPKYRGIVLMTSNNDDEETSKQMIRDH